MKERPHGVGPILANVWLGLLSFGGIILLISSLHNPPFSSDSPVDTQYSSGTHVIFVVIGAGPPGDEYVASVRRARSAFRRFANANGLLFSTVGVATQMPVDRGLWVLEQFGHFDEVDVGRTWFNTGVRMFAVEMGATTNLPQVVVILEEVDVGSHGWTSLGSRELARFVGPKELASWEDSGSPVDLEQGSPTALSRDF